MNFVQYHVLVIAHSLLQQGRLDRTELVFTTAKMPEFVGSDNTPNQIL